MAPMSAGIREFSAKDTRSERQVPAGLLPASGTSCRHIRTVRDEPTPAFELTRGG
jgi:hypothetical protein